MAPVQDAKSVADFERLTQSPLAVVHFWAPWCEPCKQMDVVLAHLATTTPSVTFLRLEAEEVDDVSMKYEVPSVPYFLFFKAGKVVDRLDGASAPALTTKLGALTSGAASPAAAAAAVPDINERLAALVHSAPVVLFMKGSPDEPKCGFSRKVVEALRSTGAPFGHFDILGDTAVREGLKTFSNWPTYPQLYCQGELLGGCDIILELAASGELATQLTSAVSTHQTAPAATAPASAPPAAAAQGGPSVIVTSGAADIPALLATRPVMLFMKGVPSAPQCGFSRKVVAALAESGCEEYGAVDILTDSELREGLKTFSSWPTYPQLYVKGELVGGCDIVLEMAASGELRKALQV